MTISISSAGTSEPRLRARPLGIFRVAALASLAAAGACATRSDVRVLQNDLRVMRIESMQADSARRAQLDAIIAALGRTQDSLRLIHAQGVKFQGDSRGEMYALGQQLIQIQELTGQSQRRLQELRGSLEQHRHYRLLYGLLAGLASSPRLWADRGGRSDSVSIGACSGH